MNGKDVQGWLCWCGVGGEDGVWLCGAGVVQEHSPRPKAEPRSGRGVQGGGWGWMGIAWFRWLIVRGRSVAPRALPVFSPCIVRGASVTCPWRGGFVI